MSKSEQHPSSDRRTFAIISHPDAGKTTLTEHLLLASGAIHLAGQVKARGDARRARSDWMKIERQRGISISASVMTFEYKGLTFNLLDTPGHEDFSEDTYRTLTAADSAIMVLDAAKGVEAQTLKLFEVCRLRDIPILTFINKIDREAKDIFSLFDEIHEKLALDVAPMMIPAGSGRRFSGALELATDEFLMYQSKLDPGDRKIERIPFQHLKQENRLSKEVYLELEDARELIRSSLPVFNQEDYLKGHLTPVYFGSALRHFAVKTFLDALRFHLPAPSIVKTVQVGQDKQLSPKDQEVTGFVFKMQANMDPQHHDRVAFIKLCSGMFKKGMKLKTRHGKSISIHTPVSFFAQDRDMIETAYAGDIIGVPNHGSLRVGDSLSEKGKTEFSGLPNFAPEILRIARTKDPMKTKHLKKALESLAEEGIVQLFRPLSGFGLIVGAVGALQFDVMIERMQVEYKLDVLFETVQYQTVRWLRSDKEADLKQFIERNHSSIAEDSEGKFVLLAKSEWEANYLADKFSKIDFLKTRERHI